MSSAYSFDYSSNSNDRQGSLFLCLPPRRTTTSSCFPFSFSWNKSNRTSQATNFTSRTIDTIKTPSSDSRRNQLHNQQSIMTQQNGEGRTANHPNDTSGGGFIQKLLNTACAMNAFLNIPMYSMGICFSLYFIAIFYLMTTCDLVSSLWMKTLILVAYPTYIIVDPSPRATNKPKFVKLLQTKCRRFWTLKWVGQYFPCQLHKTVDLNPTKDPNEKYIFLYHPHGVISMGANIALNTEGCNFESTFPGVSRRSSVTLNATFLTPIFREWLLLLGFCSANKQTMKHRLNDGESLILVPGGAAEALHAHTGIMKLYIKNRKGFVKLAIETDSKLIPVIGFGENDIFHTLYAHNSSRDDDDNNNNDNCYGRSSSTSPMSKTGRGLSHVKSMIWELQQQFLKVMSFSLPILTNLIPNRVPVNVVVGAPVIFKNSSLNNIDQCHEEYLAALTKLYDQHKSKYGYDHVELEII